MKEPSSILDCLEKAAPRPAEDSNRGEKKNYAQRLSESLALKFSNSLRKHFPGISPQADGTEHEKRSRTGKGFKKLDVNYSTADMGLGLGLSVKTIGFRDPGSNRYTKNITRIDNELRAEAMDHHTRQPYAILIAVTFLPIDSCDEPIKLTKAGAPPKSAMTSFAHAVNTWRFRAGRSGPLDPAELFERLFIGLYEKDGENRGNVGFFDVMHERPPKYRRPDSEDLITFDQVVSESVREYERRNDPPLDWDTSLPSN